MTTPALAAATGPAALAGTSAGPAAPEGVFAGLLAEAAPAAAGAHVASAPALSTDADALLGLLELEVETPQEPVLPDGTLLGAAALGLVPTPLLPAAPLPGDAPAAASLTVAAPVAAAGPAADGAPGPVDPVDAAPTTAPTAVVPQQRSATGSAPAVAGTDVPAGVASVPTEVPTEVPTGVPGQVPATASAPAVAPAPVEAAVPTATAPTGLVAADEAVDPTAPSEAPSTSPAAAATGDRPVEAAAPPLAPVEAAPVQPAGPAGTAPTTPVAPAPLERLAAETGPEQVRPAVAELARGLRDAGGGRASLVVRLDPPELGPVLVRLTVQDGRVDVQLRTSESVAAVGLGQASADVRSTLLEHGLDLSSFDVASDSEASFSQQLSQGSPDRGTPGRRQGADNGEGASGAGAPTGVITETTADGAPAGAWL